VSGLLRLLVLVIPEGAGPCKTHGAFFWIFFGGLWTRPGEARGSRLGRSPTAERPKGLDAGVAGRTLWATEKVLGAGGLSWGVVGRVRLQRRVPGGGQAKGLPVIPSPRCAA
jgi:hypothetical protein